ncbi:Uncharacterised protein [Vibrio cholerae]|nr:Uncharacterised protein [Vibrio cholerae]
MCLPPINTCGTVVRPETARRLTVVASLPKISSSYCRPASISACFALAQ